MPAPGDLPLPTLGSLDVDMGARYHRWDRRDGDGLCRHVGVRQPEHRVRKPLLQFGVVAQLLEQLGVVLE